MCNMEVNQPAPDFELPDLTGTIHRLSDYRGRIVIINFWSADCPFVERVDKELSILLTAWGAQVVLLTILINVNESEEVAAAAGGARGLPVILRGNSSTQSFYGAQTTPHLFVVDPSGILRYRGAFDDLTFRQRKPARSYLQEAVEALLTDRLPDPAETQPYGCAILRFVLE